MIGRRIILPYIILIKMNYSYTMASNNGKIIEYLLINQTFWNDFIL